MQQNITKGIQDKAWLSGKDWELCNHTIKWFMHKPESVLENETHNILLYRWFNTGIPLVQAEELANLSESD